MAKQVDKSEFDYYISGKYIKEVDGFGDDIYIRFEDGTAACVEIFHIKGEYGNTMTEHEYYIDC